jgi:uncharacterized protein
MQTPFVKPFTAHDRRFLYDVGTNNIMEVDEALYKMACHAALDESTGTFRPTPDAPRDGADLDAALREMEKYHREMGFFAPNTPRRMTFPFSRDELQAILDQLVGHVILNVTENCNNRCSYCKFSGAYKHARLHNERTMSTAVALDAIRFMFARSRYLVTRTDEHLSIGFYGGEPLLAFPLIKECVQFARDEHPDLMSRLTFAMTTNLMVVDQAILDFLIDTDVSILVSLDGPQHLHDRYRHTAGGQGTFVRVLENLRYLRAKSERYYNTRVGFSVVMAPPYDLEAVVRFFATEGLTTERRVTLNFVDGDDTTFFTDFCGGDNGERAAGEQLDRLRAEYESRLESGLRDGMGIVLDRLFGDRVKDIYNRPLLPLPPAIYPNGICIPGFTRVLVGPDGEIYVCEKVGYDLPIGSIRTGFDLDAIMAAVQKYISISESCSSCWAVRFCKMCFAGAVGGCQMDGGRKASHCDGIRGGVLKALRTFPKVMDLDPAVVQPLFKREQTDGGMDLAFRFIAEYRKQKGELQAASVPATSE